MSGSVRSGSHRLRTKGALMMRFVAGVIIAWLALTAPSMAQDLAWSEYRNEHLGLSLSLPTRVFRLERSANAGDGHLFRTKDGRGQLLIGALENTEGHTPATYQRLIARRSYPGFDVDYAPVGRSWSVMSGERDGTIFYEKVIFNCDGTVINSFALTYPTEQRELFDGIVEEIEDTFRVGAGSCS
jgi:hypothetical protein